MTDLTTRTRNLRIEVAVAAARGAHVFDRTLLNSPTPMPPATAETNLLACFASVHGFQLVEVLRILENHGDPDLLGYVLDVVEDIGREGDDGRSADIWPAVEAKLAEGGVGTDKWETERLNPSLAAKVPDA